MSKATDFRKLHKGSEPFILGNIWDAKSAQLAQKTGIKALGISGHAIAENLGFADGENMSYDDLLLFVKRIIKSVTVPLSVDIDGGYSRDVKKVKENIGKLIDLGVSGINIEDSIVKNGKRSLTAPDKFSKIIHGIRKYLDKQHSELFMNVRIDTYVTKHPKALEETISRIKTFEKAGADGFFIPLLLDEKEIKVVVESTQLPINVFLKPEIPTFEKLKELGVKRISSGAAVHAMSYAKAEDLYSALIDEHNFKLLF
ncbi:MAG: isocitrate lyase/PEP mutase family protein [Paludibacteraceae bacterium]